MLFLTLEAPDGNAEHINVAKINFFTTHKEEEDNGEEPSGKIFTEIIYRKGQDFAVIPEHPTTFFEALPPHLQNLFVEIPTPDGPFFLNISQCECVLTDVDEEAFIAFFGEDEEGFTIPTTDINTLKDLFGRNKDTNAEEEPNPGQLLH